MVMTRSCSGACFSRNLLNTVWYWLVAESTPTGIFKVSSECVTFVLTFSRSKFFQIRYLIFFIGRVGRCMSILKITELWSEIIRFSTITSRTIFSENREIIKSRVWPWRWVDWRTCCIRPNASIRLSSCWACWSFSWFSTWRLKSPMSTSSPVEIDKPSKRTVKSAIKAPTFNLFLTEGGGRYKTIKRAHLPVDFKRSSKCSNDWNDSVCCLFMSMLFLYKIPTPHPLPWVRGSWSSLYPVGVMSFSKQMSSSFRWLYKHSSQNNISDGFIQDNHAAPLYVGARSVSKLMHRFVKRFKDYSWILQALQFNLFAKNRSVSLII